MKRVECPENFKEFFEDKRKCMLCKNFKECLKFVSSWSNFISKMQVLNWGILLGIISILQAVINPHKVILVVALIFIIILIFSYHLFSLKQKRKMKMVMENYIDEYKRLHETEFCKGDKCSSHHLLSTTGLSEMEEEAKVALYQFIDEIGKCTENSKTIYQSRNEYLEAASISRGNAVESHHVMYLTDSSIAIYQNEGEKWLEDDKDVDMSINQRIVIIDKEDFDNIPKFRTTVLKIVTDLQNTSIVKCTFSNKVKKWNADLLKDYGIFKMQGGIYHGFFIMPNFRKFCKLKFLFSMSTGDFYKLEGDNATYIIAKYETLFNKAWTTGDIRWICSEELKRLCCSTQ